MRYCTRKLAARAAGFLSPTLDDGNLNVTIVSVPLTRHFKETIRARVERDPKFRRELLREGVEALLGGDVDTAKTILRDYINATLGFTDLAKATQTPSKSLMRMFGPAGNPRATNLFEIISFFSAGKACDRRSRLRASDGVAIPYAAIAGSRPRSDKLADRLEVPGSRAVLLHIESSARCFPISTSTRRSGRAPNCLGSLACRLAAQECIASLHNRRLSRSHFSERQAHSSHSTAAVGR